MARNAFAYAVLGSLAVAGTAVLITAPGLADTLARLPDGRRDPRRVSRAISALCKKGYLALTGTRGARMAHVTALGKKRAFLEGLAAPTGATHRWDGTWFMVAFDIPVELLRARDALRHALKRLGFVEFQKSVYVYPFGCESEIDFIIDHFGITPFVSYFYAADLNRDTELRGRFQAVIGKKR